MSDAVGFMRSYAQNCQTLVNILSQLQIQNQQLTDDSTLVTRYFQSSQARADIASQDVTNTQNAIVQMLFTYNSGTPTNAQYLLKMMP